ncbi:MAG: radical SAM protein [bacterium]
MKFKILLIKPNLCVRKGFYLQEKMCPPLGLAYLAGSLIEAGYEVEILDMVAASSESWPYKTTHIAHGLTDQGLIEKIKEYGPDLAGVGGFTSQYSRIKDIIAAIKAFNPEIKIVAGGVHATVMPEQMMKETKVDFVIRGEGELAMVALTRALEAKDYKKIESIDGIGYRDGDKIVINPKVNFEQNLDNLPWPARQLFDYKKYIEDDQAMPVITSRSCPGRCSFCSVHLFSGYAWRARDPIKVVDEIEAFVKRWGYKTVSIFDDACNIIPQRLITILQEIIRRQLKIKITFPGGLVTKYITKDLLYWMKQSGVVSLIIPLEHSNEHMRNNVIGKNLDIEKAFEVLNWCRELEILTMVNFVIGMPGETKESIEDIIQFIKKNALLVDALAVYIATPFPGSPFYDQCLEKGYLLNPVRNNFLDFDLYSTHIETTTMPSSLLENYKKTIEQAFLEARGKDFPADYIRKAIRKPDEETSDYIHNAYFKNLKSPR